MELLLIPTTEIGRGYINISRDDTAAADHILFGKNGSVASSIGTSTTNSLTFKTGTTERMRIDSSGRLLINTTNGVELIYGVGGGLKLARNKTGNPTSSQSLMAVGFHGVDDTNSNSTAEAKIEAFAAENHSGTTAAADLRFFTKSSGTGPGSSPTERVRINANGAVGIGTTSNSNKLRIHEGSDTPNVVIVTGADESSEFLALGVNSGVPCVTAGGVSNTSAQLAFRTADNGTESEAARIDKDGRFIARMTATWDSSIGHQFRAINTNGWALNANSLNTGGQIICLLLQAEVLQAII